MINFFRGFDPSFCHVFPDRQFRSSHYAPSRNRALKSAETQKPPPPPPRLPPIPSSVQSVHRLYSLFHHTSSTIRLSGREIPTIWSLSLPAPMAPRSSLTRKILTSLPRFSLLLIISREFQKCVTMLRK